MVKLLIIILNNLNVICLDVPRSLAYGGTHAGLTELKSEVHATLTDVDIHCNRKVNLK